MTKPVSGDMAALGARVNQAGASNAAGQAKKAEDAEIDALALRGAKALSGMSPTDRDTVMKQVPGYVADIASTVVGGALDNKLLGRSKAQLTKLIEQGTSRIATLTAEAGDRVAVLRDALSTEGQANAAREAAPALAAIAKAAGATPEQFERLVAQLEILRDLKDSGAARQLDRDVRIKIYAFATGPLAELAQTVGHQLGRLAYDPVNRAWQAGS